MGPADGPEVAVVGLGNPLLSDDGIGLAALEMLQGEWWLPPAVHLVDGGTWGMSLLPTFEDARRLLLLDAVECGREPGEVVVLRGEEIPAYLDRAVSTHQVGVRDVLALARFRGTLPEGTVVVGMQPERLDVTGELSPCARAALPAMVERSVRQLQAWGITCRPGGRSTEAAEEPAGDPCTR